MKLRLIGSFVCLMMLVLSSTALATTPEVKNPGGTPQKSTASKYKLHLKLSPTHPYVDDSQITISWNVERSLKPGYHFVGDMVNHTSYAYKCANRVSARTYGRIKGGQEAHLVFESLQDGDYEWCAGRFELSIAVQSNKVHCEESICEAVENIGLNWFIEAYVRIFNRP
ncbi:MAG TPA: hypothetical protein VNY31_10020 [Solirubrobacteraceae bacterium]|nr:hypothetical protein [Solirubrobacteraceae bacterium]